MTAQTPSESARIRAVRRLPRHPYCLRTSTGGLIIVENTKMKDSGGGYWPISRLSIYGKISQISLGIRDARWFGMCWHHPRKCCKKSRNELVRVLPTFCRIFPKNIWGIWYRNLDNPGYQTDKHGRASPTVTGCHAGDLHCGFRAWLLFFRDSHISAEHSKLGKCCGLSTSRTLKLRWPSESPDVKFSKI